jgi:hypothetical protein
MAGASTINIAAGMRATELETGLKKMFITSDIFPHVHAGGKLEADMTHGKGDGALASYYPHYWKCGAGNTNCDPDGAYDLCIDYDCLHSGTNLGEARYHVSTPPGGLHNALIGMLGANKLQKHVFVNTGTAYPTLPYGSGFIDCAHSFKEIVHNMDAWTTMIRLRNGAPAIFQFHDIHQGYTGEHLEACKRLFHKIFNIKYETNADESWALEIHGLQPDADSVIAGLPALNTITTTDCSGY